MANHLGFTRETCTDLSCAWNNDFVRKVVPSPVSKITFFNKTVTDRIRATKTRPKLEPSTPAQQEQFLAMLMANCPEKHVVLSIYNKYAGMFRSAPVIKECQKLPTGMRTLYQPSAATMNSEILDTELAEIMLNLKTNPVEIAYLQSQTLTPRHSLVWYKMWAGRITSSTAHDVIRTNPEKPAKSLIREICIPKVSFPTKDMKWGIDNEKNVKLEYSEYMEAEGHTDIAVVECGP